MKKALQTTMDFGALGVKLRVAGRLGGAEISRAEQSREGKTPLHTLRAHIDYGFHEAHTLYGKIGVKCWICKRDPGVVDKEAENKEAEAVANRRDNRRGGGDRRGGNNDRRSFTGASGGSNDERHRDNEGGAGASTAAPSPAIASADGRL